MVKQGRQMAPEEGHEQSQWLGRLEGHVILLLVGQELVDPPVLELLHVGGAWQCPGQLWWRLLGWRLRQ